MSQYLWTWNCTQMILLLKAHERTQGILKTTAQILLSHCCSFDLWLEIKWRGYCMWRAINHSLQKFALNVSMLHFASHFYWLGSSAPHKFCTGTRMLAGFLPWDPCALSVSDGNTAPPTQSERQRLKSVKETATQAQATIWCRKAVENGYRHTMLNSAKTILME